MTIIDAIFNAVSQAVAKIAEALVSGAEALMFNAEGDLTTLSLVVFTLLGLSIGFAIVKWILGLVKIR
ncbi:MAG: hypothetical protein QXW48_03910 [Thermoplasmata archaeon]